MTLLILDAADTASTMQRFKLAKELRALTQERQTLTASTADVMRKMQIGKRTREIVLALGMRPAAPAESAVPAQAAQTGRIEPTAEYYPEEGKRTLSQRQKANNEAVALIRQLQAGEIALTDEVREKLAKYSGNGGGLVNADGLSGSPHEYYTPKEIAGAMWDLLGELGFAGGSVLDPSAGTGVFTAMRPKAAVMTQVELDKTSGAINAAINDGPTVSTTVSPFEAHAASTPDEIYDAVITNVPFGDHDMRGDNYLADPRFQKENLQTYFVLRSLQKLKPGGLAAFVVPKSIVSGKGGGEVKLRQRASLMAEFVGAYRLPNKIFTTAAADVTTDVIVFRKFSREAKAKIEELQEQNPDVLRAANVLWEEFIEGRYFAGEGKKYILGEEGTKSGKFGEVAAVLSDDSIANIAKMIRRFPQSHINWELLNATETAPIIYADGDVIHKDGQTLEMRDGEWHALASDVAANREMIDTGTKVKKPLDVVNFGINWEQANAYLEYARNMGLWKDVSPWLMAVQKGMAKLGEGDKQPWWEAITAGMAVMQLTQEGDATEPFNYKDEYPILSGVLARVQSYGNKSIAGAPALVRDGLQCIRNARLRGEWTPFWTGQIKANIETKDLTPTQIYEKTRYESEDETGYVPVEKLREAFSDFDPLEAEDWCVAADGASVMHANDYYVGNYGDFLKRANAELEAATDPAVRAKIVRQIEAAKARVNIVDVSQMTFSLFTPHVTNLQKLEFLKQYVSSDIYLTTDADGRETFDIKQPSLSKHATAEQAMRYKSLQRFVKGYLKNQNITTQTRKADAENDPETEAALVRAIKEIADATKAQFDAWARANPEIQASLEERLNSPDALRFIETPDGTPLDIPNLVDGFKPHAYQYAAARRYARHFGGVLGFDVGLGKTFTALISTQYAHSIGVKKKTFFVVPNATLTNWKKEAGRAYADTSDCLFVGVIAGKDGKDKVDNAQVKIDLNRIRENRHSKIFMTLEAFKLIPLRDETMQAYVEYLQQNDDAFALVQEAEEETDGKKAKAKAKDKIKADNQSAEARDVGAKSLALPYFEDMGVDSLVLDEAHNYKNSKMTSSEFKGAKYLADPTKSQRGMDMQAKAWFVRGLTARNDGVLSLTATPITNSPLEVYAMLTLAMGEREVNAMYGVTGADSFMAGACDIEERDEENIVGVSRPVRVFTGLQNAGLLRRLLQSSALIKTADDVKADGIDIKVPEYDEIATGVDIGEDNFATIVAYKDEYIKAVEALAAGASDPETKLIASPFNLIRKMTKVINDPELDVGYFTFKFSPAEADKAAKVIEAFNKKNIVEDRENPDLNAADGDTKTRFINDTETGEKIARYLVTIRARLAKRGSAIELLSTDYNAQDVFLKICDANGLDPDINVSPKLAAVIENVRQEHLNPRHEGQAKQIVFCDELSLHHKLKLALAKQVGIPSAKIKIVNAASVDVAGMQDVQDGFNADHEENKYLIVIANKKAEVGINLQRGCQAIHHMTIGWTPDSIHQRNGRGVRQGNPLASVRVYHYDADGTFDSYKRKLVGIKADWIGALMSGESSRIKIDGDMSKSDYEMLANAVGDVDAMGKIEAAIAERNKLEKQRTAKNGQMQSARIIEKNRDWLARYGAGSSERAASSGFAAWVNSKISAIRDTKGKISALNAKIEKTESQLSAARLGKERDKTAAMLATQLEVLKGLPTDSGGSPLVRNDYQLITGTDRATVAFANWQRDVNMAERMIDESATRFSRLSDEGYSNSALSAFRAGDAQIANGQLAVLGSFVEWQGALRVVSKVNRWNRSINGLVAFLPADESELEIAKMTGAEFIEPGSAKYSECVRRAVALDEALIAANEGDGFSANDEKLYATRIAAVREGITVVIPSANLDRDSFTFKSPLFPFPLESDAEGGSPLIDKIKAEQAAIVSEGSSYRTVKVSDLRLVQPSAGHDTTARAAAVREYCIAHRMRATDADLKAINSNYLSIRRVVNELELKDEFMKALPQGVAVCKSPEQLDTWSLAWFNERLDWVTVTDLEDVLGYSMSDYRDIQNRIDDGSERWVIVRDELRTTLATPFLEALKAAIGRGWKVKEILDAQAGSYGSYMPSSFSTEVAPREFAELIFTDNGDYIELTGGVDKVRAYMRVNPNVRLYVENWGEAATLVMGTVSTRWAEMCGWAKAARSRMAFEGSGLDLAGMLKVLEQQPGVDFARVATQNATFSGDKYIRGSFEYEAGKYILLGLAKGGATARKVSVAGAAGLQGRTFDYTASGFRIMIDDGHTFSNGAAVASLRTLFDKLGINLSDYKL